MWLILLHAAKNENNKRCSDAESVTAFFKKCILCSFMGLKSQYLLGWRQSGVTLDQSRPRTRVWHGAFSRLRASTGPAQHLARNKRTILGKLFTIIWRIQQKQFWWFTSVLRSSDGQNCSNPPCKITNSILRQLFHNQFSSGYFPMLEIEILSSCQSSNQPRQRRARLWNFTV